MNILKEIDTAMTQINKIKPFEGIYHKEIGHYYKIETTYTSNVIEGNTYTLNETIAVLEDGTSTDCRSAQAYYEIAGHGKAYDYMFNLIEKPVLTEADILQCHLLYSQNIPGFKNPGKYRNFDIHSDIFVSQDQSGQKTKEKLPKAAEIPAKMKEYIEWLKKERNYQHPVLFSAEAHRKLINIYPFSDGNGKIARLVMNTCLFQEKLLPVCIPLVKHEEYFEILERNDSKEIGNFIANLELQTIKDLMQHFNIEL